MGDPGSSSRTLTIRFRNSDTHAALREAARELGVSMSELVERAIEHELAVSGVAVRGKLQRCAERSKNHQHRTGGEDAAVFACAEVSEDDPLRSQYAPAPRDPWGVSAALTDSKER